MSWYELGMQKGGREIWAFSFKSKFELRGMRNSGVSVVSFFLLFFFSLMILGMLWYEVGMQNGDREIRAFSFKSRFGLGGMRNSGASVVGYAMV